MAFRNIIIENRAIISLKNDQLIICTDKEYSVAIEDISSVMLENRQSTITTAALSRLGQCGCAVFLCDEKHIPCAVVTPFMQHSRMTQVINRQLSLSEPLKKRLWQAIVKAKILNQALALGLNEKQAAEKQLLSMVSQVKSGDSDNIEATAAQKYFPNLFGKSFTRAEDNGINSGLNYGYAIIRGYAARTLAIYGFIPALGLHHNSTLNLFNLADDIMEPFRPIVDMVVYRSFGSDDILDRNKKRLLFNVLALDILSGGQHHSVAYAIERTVQSLSRCIENKEVRLILPELLEPELHRYE